MDNYYYVVMTMMNVKIKYKWKTIGWEYWWKRKHVNIFMGRLFMYYNKVESNIQKLEQKAPPDEAELEEKEEVEIINPLLPVL